MKESCEEQSAIAFGHELYAGSGEAPQNAVAIPLASTLIETPLQAVHPRLIEVGTGLSPRSPLRTGRADLPHPALQSVVFSVTEARDFSFSGV